MDIAEILTPQCIVPKLSVTSKKQALQALAKHAGSILDLKDRTIFDALLRRERLGTTGVGHGVAIPHGKLPEIDKLVGFFARLEKPIDFDAVDEQPVDLLFLLLAPETAGADHLKALARVSRLLRNRAICDKIRGSSDADALFALITDNHASFAA
ncbi:MAG: PTS IIA-like nitrogen regulatory protein PtsN [Alphaproteobacteria bacterium]|nr:PTS IIA-like nitrogen regulatory protein PtsN [Alphaproteobacteria bacterium]